jgi:hypothetical protein
MLKIALTVFSGCNPGQIQIAHAAASANGEKKETWWTHERSIEGSDNQNAMLSSKMAATRAALS